MPGAQEQGSGDSRVIFERERSNMHPGDPLRIIGLAEGDDEFLSRAPALQSSNRVVARVDLDELHERRVAMISSGRVFSSPPVARSPEPLARASSEPVVSATPAAEAIPKRGLSEAARSAIVVGVVLGALLLVRYLVRSVMADH